MSTGERASVSRRKNRRQIADIKESAELQRLVVRKESEPPFVELVETTGGGAFDKLRQRRREFFSRLLK